ncbi:EAL domain-containing protein [uncultured Fibrobacter sp.]|uniref:EAL and HDOD domain-containing protein n=1 Tax=uncultured Fibrobacter sp. TaxID=261512 RepID=UPI00262A2A46|nr:EAL domain-containing protein [uncultured Fibrobacter sp.]
MHSLAYLARQPILDREGKIYAYELLFRDSPESDIAVIASDVLATAQVLENVLNNIGIQRLIGKNKAFVNCSRNMLLDNLFGLLNPKYFVLEVLEDVLVDDAIVKSVQRYRSLGFELAIDDFIFNDEFIKRFEPLFPYVSYIKMDVVDNSLDSMTKAATFFKQKGIRLLAEKVEDEATFKRCEEAGYDYFQGFFFAKPELVTGKKIDATSATILQLLLRLKSKPNLEDLCEFLDRNPDLSENLLRFVNSDALTRHGTIRTVKDAIVWIGIQRIQEWLMLMLYARPELGMTPQASPLFQNASHRAKFLESLARTIDNEDSDFCAKAFMVGLISRMDALVRAPLETILPDAPADDEMQDALLNRSGRLGNLLRLADAVELDDRESIRICLTDLGLNFAQLKLCINESYSFANEH